MRSNVRARLDPTLYPQSAVDRAIAAYTGVVTIQRDLTASEWVTIESTEQRGADEFLNYALMASLELHLATA